MTSCAVCGAPSPQKFRLPRPLQPPDLDGRPGEPLRSTLDRWVATCRRCGVSAPDLSALPALAAETIRTKAYLALCKPGPDMPHRRWACLAEAFGQRRQAAEATLAAAWALEDASLPAAHLRKQAVALFNTLPDGIDLPRLIDILRRAGAFEDASTLLGRMNPRNNIEAALLSFERARIAAGDTSRQQISAALPPPAHRPHVSHGKTTPRGFLAKLFSQRS